ncbi:MAG: hypothetical protein U0234_21180 [Sandaracinus sp.]
MELFGLTRSQIALWSLTALAVLGLGTAVADAMVETDAERLGEVARVVEQGAPSARVDGLLAWADPAREPVYLTHGRTRYRIDDGADLPDALHDVLAPLDREGAVDVVQDDVSVEGETGTVAIGARVDGERVDVRLTLRREGQGWLLSGVSAY